MKNINILPERNDSPEQLSSWEARLKEADSNPWGCPMDDKTEPWESAVYGYGDPRTKAAFKRYQEDYWAARPEEAAKIAAKYGPMPS
ncbi:MAG: hypothetical protein LBS59_09170 [Puniceicoccales bacterium]|jgi:hypothetical protein|nr:hypothetical protein [Puniceicoccales bacterium]